jgi:hypothetical protein
MRSVGALPVGSRPTLRPKLEEGPAAGRPVAGTSLWEDRSTRVSSLMGQG